MGWLSKLLRREKTHDEWLEKHPGKESTKSAPYERPEGEEQAMRSRMEAELDAQRTKRDDA